MMKFEKECWELNFSRYRPAMELMEMEHIYRASPGFYSSYRNRYYRSVAVSTIAKIWQGDVSDAFVPYLAMQFFGRFVSRHPLHDLEVPLAAISCLALAFDIREYRPLQEFLNDKGIVNVTLDAVLEMQIHINEELVGGLLYITPFDFVEHYCPYFKGYGVYKIRSIFEMIIQSQGDCFLAQHKPSVLAQCAFMAYTHIAYPEKIRTFLDQKGEHHELVKCMKKMVDICLDKDIEVYAEKSVKEAKNDELEEEEESPPKELTNFRIQWGTLIPQPELNY